MTTTPSTQLLTQLAHSFPNLDELIHDLQASEAQLHQLAQTSDLSTNLQTTLRLASIRFQLLTAQLADAALTTLGKILTCGKPETARRAANTLLTLGGFLPSKSPKSDPKTSPKPTPQSAITKQHMPTYTHWT